MKVLLHSHFPAGHACPMQAVAAALVARGHAVVWLTAAANEARARAAGAVFVATRALAAVDAPLAAAHATGLFAPPADAAARLRARIAAQMADYRAVLAAFAADVLLVDVFPHGARALHEAGELPAYATLGVIPLYASAASSPLPASGRPPAVSWPRVAANAARHAANRWLLFPLRLAPAVNRQRAEAGLARLPYGEHAEFYAYSPQLHMQASSPRLEFFQDPRSARHRQSIKYVGPLVDESSADAARLPAWWPEVVEHQRVVGITQGTLAMDPASLIVPSIQALPDSDVLLVVVSPHLDDIVSRIGKPANARFAEWLPYHLLLPQLSLLITNGGYGSITQALSHKVPLLCAGQSEDKRDTAARVAWCGVGIDLKMDSPTSAQIRAAARHILDERAYRDKARMAGDELNNLGGAVQACIHLEALAARSTK